MKQPRPFALALAASLALALPRIAHAQRMLLDSGFSPPVAVVSGMSGGPVPADSIDSSCRGSFPPRPQHVIVTRTGFALLHTFVQSSGDNTLAVRGPNGQIWCNDDTYGLNPSVDLQGVPPGRYEIFVGSYSSGQSYPYQFYVTENAMVNPNNVAAFMASNPGTGGMIQGGPANTGPYVGGPTIGPNIGQPQPPPPQSGPLDTTQRPMFGTIDVRQSLRGPRSAMGTTRNANEGISGIPGQGVCRGFVTPAPSFVVRLQQPQPFLRFFVNSAADTTMVIQRPDGSIQCDDDSGGHLQPMISGSFDPGTYYVWVGIYRAGMTHPFRLTITPDANAHP